MKKGEHALNTLARGGPSQIVAAITTIIVFLGYQSSAYANGLAGVYQGRLRCADCPGIKYTIRFWKNHTFELDIEYMERHVSSHDSGTYLMSPKGSVVTLKSNHKGFGDQQRFEISKDGNVLHSMLPGQTKSNPDEALVRISE